MKDMARSLGALAFLLSIVAAASARKLIAFGDSITDNGNGTSKVVQAYYSRLLNQAVTAVSIRLLDPKDVYI